MARRAAPWMIGSDDWFTDVERLRSAGGLADRRRRRRRRAGARDRATAWRSPRATSRRSRATASSCSPTSTRRTTTPGGASPTTPAPSWSRSSATPARPGPTAVLRQIDERTRVVAVPNVHWTDGALVDLDAVAAAAHDLGAAVVIDASQSLGAMPLDVAGSSGLRRSVGYKWLLGPLGVGCLYVAERHRGGRADRGELDQPGRVGGLHRARRLHRHLPAGRAPLRRRPAHELRAGADGDRRAGAASRVAGRCGRRGPGRCHRRHRRRAWAGSASTPSPRRERGPHILGIDLPGNATAPAVEAMRERGVARASAAARCASLRTCTSASPTSTGWWTRSPSLCEGSVRGARVSYARTTSSTAGPAAGRRRCR